MPDFEKLPADLPENWTNNQTISASGVETGLTDKHGYNYLMKQVNATQKTVNQSVLDSSTGVWAELDKKVDKVNGKGLSTNDYTTIDKNKISEIDKKLNAPIAIPSSSNLNNYTTPGLYYCGTDASAATILNAPAPHSFSLLVELGAGGQAVQTAISWRNPQRSIATIYIRNQYPNWSGGWIQLVDNTSLDAILTGKVSKSGDTMTGALTLQGVNKLIFKQSGGNVVWFQDDTGKGRSFFGYPGNNEDFYINNSVAGGIIGLTATNINVNGASLLDYGSNANGHFQRFVNGIAMCWGIVSYTNAPLNTNLSVQVPLPISLITIPYYIANMYSVIDKSNLSYAYVTFTLTQGVEFRVTGGPVQNHAFMWQAIGRWK